MTWSELKRLLNLTSWWVRAAIAAAILLLIYGALTYGAHQKELAAQAAAGATLAGARSQSAGEALDRVDQNASNAAAIDARVKGSLDAIHEAPVADRDAVALRELCHSPSARADPQCRLLKPGS